MSEDDLEKRRQRVAKAGNDAFNAKNTSPTSSDANASSSPNMATEAAPELQPVEDPRSGAQAKRGEDRADKAKRDKRQAAQQTKQPAPAKPNIQDQGQQKQEKTEAEKFISILDTQARPIAGAVKSAIRLINTSKRRYIYNPLNVDNHPFLMFDVNEGPDYWASFPDQYNQWYDRYAKVGHFAVIRYKIDRNRKTVTTHACLLYNERFAYSLRSALQNIIYGLGQEPSLGYWRDGNNTLYHVMKYAPTGETLESIVQGDIKEINKKAFNS